MSTGGVTDISNSRPKAVLVGVHLQGTSDVDFRASLEELSRLCDTLGFDVVGEVTQKRGRPSSAAGLGAGKLKDLARYTGGPGVIASGAKPKKQRKDLHKPSGEPIEEDDDDEEEGDEDGALATAEVPKATVVVVDNELSPSQIRNLEKATGVEVLDRTGVIIEIFWRHARTKEAQLQVEIARLQYEAPRLREKEHSGDRQRGGGVGGKGDDDVEMDRRRIRDRIAELKEKLQEAVDSDVERRSRRKDALRAALVGYTNAGKSSLMRALTGSEVLVADRLFATLGTTVRALVPESHLRILISDTVGFIKNLPHSLVASFRSTLDEAHDASVLLFVVDASDPAFRSQLAVTREVLSEIGAEDIPSILVLNKIDRVDEDERKKLRFEFKDAVQMSALNKDDVRRLRDLLVERFEENMQEAQVLVPHAKAGSLYGTIREHVRVVSEEWDEDGAQLVIKGPKESVERVLGLVKG